MRLDNLHDQCLVDIAPWKLVRLDGIAYLELKDSSGCYFTIEERPPHCDRGNWIVKITDPGEYWIDGQDGWPRYFFDLSAAITEVNYWLAKRARLRQDKDRA